MFNKSKLALSVLFEMVERFYESRMERAQMRFAPTRCADVLPPAPMRAIVHTH